jgi:Ca2+-binding EF-hand superfamily protein
MRACGQDPTEEDLQATIDEFGADVANGIDFDAFVKIMQKWKTADNDEHKATFDAFDTDGDGFINAKELKEMMDTCNGLPFSFLWASGTLKVWLGGGDRRYR